MPADTMVAMSPASGGGAVKSERFSPELSARSSISRGGSASPASPSSSSPAPSFKGTPSGDMGLRRGPSSSVSTAGSMGSAFTPPHPAMTPPDRFSPAGHLNNNISSINNNLLLGGKPLMSTAGGAGPDQPVPMVPRNYSDYIRSLAAKYNNSNPNDYYGSSANGFFRGFDPRPGFSFKPGGTPLYGLGPAKDLSPKGAVEATSPGGIGSLLGGAAAAGATMASLSNLSALQPMLDMSSTQALLNVVRNVNSQNATQLETYLRNVMKRPADAAAPLGASNPLDLSNPPPKKIAKLDYDHNPYGSRDFKDLFGLRSASSSSERDAASEDEQKHMASSASTAAQQNPGKSSSSSKTVKTSPPSPKTPNKGRASPGAYSNRSSSSPSAALQQACLASCGDRLCAAKREEVEAWDVDRVCVFVRSIDLCADYADVFKEQCIDGSALPLLTEEHLTNSMGMKLGPALKFRSVLAKRIGQCPVCVHCIHCHVTGEKKD